MPVRTHAIAKKTPQLGPKAKRAPSASKAAKTVQPPKAKWSFAPTLAAAAPPVPILQTALEVGPPDDEFEREADRVADHVVGMPGTAGEAIGGGEREDEALQRKLASTPEEEPVSGVHRAVQRLEVAEDATEQNSPNQSRKVEDEEKVGSTAPLQRASKEEEPKKAQTAPLPVTKPEEEEPKKAQTASVQRKAKDEEEPKTAQTAPLPATKPEEEEPKKAQTAPLPVTKPEEEEPKKAQTALLQRKAKDEEEPKTAQTALLPVTKPEEEEPKKAQTALLQRKAKDEEEPKTAQTALLPVTKPEEEEPKKAQTALLQRKAKDEEEPKTAQTAPLPTIDAAVVQRQGDFFSKPPPQPEEKEEEKAPPPVQTKGRRRRERNEPSPVPHDFPRRIDETRRAGGEELPTPLRRFMEARFGQAFDRVRIHRDSAASDLADSIQARAFTIGRHVFFRRGEFQPTTQQGHKLVAHELTHVLQQRGGLHSVQREVFERTEDERAKPDKDVEEERAAERLTFKEIADFFDWRENTLPPLVFEALKDLIARALNVATSRKSLAVFALHAPADKGVRRIVRSPVHELRLEVEQRGDTRQSDTRWVLTFLDGARVPATGGQPVTIGTDEDTVTVGGPDRPKKPRAPVEPPEASAPPPPASTTDTSVGAPAGKGAATAGQPEATERAPGAVPKEAGAAPGAEAAPPAEEAPFPASPEDDPNFQGVTDRAKGAGDATGEHSDAGELGANAKDAATVTPGEQESKAEANKTDEMKGAKTPGFDKAAFVKAVLDKVRATAPKTLQDAGVFGRNHFDELQRTVEQAATAETNKTSDELNTVTEGAPNTAAVPERQGVELKPEAVGAPPADIAAEKAVPPERPPSQVEGAIEQNKTEAEAKIADLGYTNAEETFAKSNDPEMTATLEAKKAFDADTAAAPAEYRDAEKGLRATAAQDAGALGKEQLGGMFESRKNAVGQVATKQHGGKTSSETKREQVVSEVNRIFTGTETKVKNRLNGLKKTVFNTFKVESKQALETFTQRVENAEKSWEDKGVVGRAADKIGSAIMGIPNELEANLQAIRDAFIREMTGIVERLADTVKKELDAAKDDIKTGRDQLKKVLDDLDPSLKNLKEQLSAEFTGKFGKLETDVKKAESALITGLAQQFVARLQESEDILKAVRERNRDFFDDLADGITAVREKTIGLIEKLQQVFQDGVDTLMRVLDDPITFAKNFMAGVLQGVRSFAANIGTHLKAGLIEWLTGSLAGAGVTLPTSFDVKGIVGFILQLLGLTVENVKARARVIWGPKVVKAIELGVEGVKKAIEIFNILETEGVAGLFNYLKDKFTEFKDQALEKIRNAIGLELVEAAVKKIVTLLVPGGAFLQAVLSIIDAVFFFIRNAERIAELVQTVINAVKDILAGNVSALAAKVEGALASTIPVVLDFLASLIGLGGKITEVIQKALKAVTQPIQDAIDAVLLAIKNAVGALIDRILGRGGEKPKPPAPGTPMTEQQIIDAVVPPLSEPTKATDPAQALEEKKAQAEQLKKTFQPSAPQGKTLHIAFQDRSAEQVAEDHEVDMLVGFSPQTPARAPLSAGKEIIGVLKPSQFRYDGRSAEANPLTKGAVGQRTAGGLDTPFSIARKVPSDRTLKERERRRKKAEAEGREFTPTGGAFAKVYVRAHLISAALGGANNGQNLQISTISANGLLATPELEVARLLKEDAITADGKKVVDKNRKPISKTFDYKVTTGDPPPRREGSIDLTTLSPRSQDLTRGLWAAEDALVSSFQVEAQEKVHLEGGGVVDGEKHVSRSVDNKLPATFVPD